MPGAKFHKVTDILPGSPAGRTSIAQGDFLRRINGNAINDILDYTYHSYDSRLMIELTSNGRIKLVDLYKPEGTDPGLVFENPLLDRERPCGNKCIFCFIDQLPEGMRGTLYYKDDDLRLSLLQGNYVTLTNLGDEDIDRIIRLRISPVNVSVHTLNPELRSFMLGRMAGDESDKKTGYIERLAKAGITLNCQIVCCPGINDKKELAETIKGLIKLGSSVNSVSVVPVGLTSHREGLYRLRPFSRALARYTVRQVESFGRQCLIKRGSSVFYCADELYMKAGLPLPPDAFYDGYPQLENGVGMMRLFITEFMAALKEYAEKPRSGETPHAGKSVSIATGTLAAPYLTKLLHAASKKCGKIDCKVYPVANNFFGKSVTVSGLVTGRDIAEQLGGKDLGDVLLIPANMLRSGDTVFLDDMTAEELGEALGAEIRIVDADGRSLFKELINAKTSCSHSRAAECRQINAV